MSATEHKCPSCNASLPFNPVTQKWDCEYCGSSYSLEELTKEEKNKKLNEEVESTKVVDVYRCNSCGAEVVADDTTASTFCLYCGNTNILKEKMQGKFKPEYIIPFKKIKEQAQKAFKDGCKGKLFMPKGFDSISNIEKITGVYIPFWLFDATVEANMKGTGTKIKTWSDSSYNYTKKDVYSIYRAGHFEVENVPTDGALKFDDTLMQSIEPFNYEDMVDFNMSYMSGFLAEKYNVDEEEASKTAKTRIENTAAEALKEDANLSYTVVSVAEHQEILDMKDTSYALLPVWMLNIKYKGKMYPFAMNGQTGKMVGDVPVDTGKLIFYSIVGQIVAMLIVYIISGVI